jgi:Alpha/beta hydrolase family
LSSKILGRGKGTPVVLIHGLFCNSAFWIPYLHYFKDCQVTLVNVDYAGLFNSGNSVAELADYVDRMIEGKSAHLIGHSFGACLGLSLRSEFSSRSFICPTFSSIEFRFALFCSEIANLTGVDINEVMLLANRALAYKSACRQGVGYRACDRLYLSRDDPYFRYVESIDGVPAYDYNGGHFNVAEAVRMFRKNEMQKYAF